jgi:hypothetical protein
VFVVSHRPLAIVSGLTIGDYLLWNWSLNGSHDVLALVSGLSLPPLAAALVWLIALTAARLLGRATGRAAARVPARRTVRQSRSIARSRRELRRRTASVQASTASPVPSSPSRQSSSSRKLAA